MGSTFDFVTMKLHSIQMNERQFLVAGIALCFSAITYLALSQKQRETIIKRLRLRGRRISSAITPPRSLSPEKKQPSNSAPKSSEYVETFPPDRREALIEVARSLPPKRRQALGDLEFNEKSLTTNLMAFEDDYRKCDESKYTSMGVSVKEIKALGDFPDYATLAGVPLPDAYPEFDIDKAKPRPYRPFRWAYHQTMCKSQYLTTSA
jgi:hypothetical protein